MWCAAEINYIKWFQPKMMFDRAIYVARRAALISKMGSRGVVVIPGNSITPNSYPANGYNFRQDSTFRYLFGLDKPSLWGVIDLESGESSIYGDDGSLEDVIWTGAQPTLRSLAAEVGVESTSTIEGLRGYLSQVSGQGRRIHTLPIYRAEERIELASMLNINISQLSELHSGELIFGVAELRERKGAEEIEALDSCYEIGYEMHTAAMRQVREGVVEREIGGRLEGIARSLGQGVSFPPICTQHGETLHNVEREGRLEAGRLMLCDAGGESLAGYCSDHTRTYPISGRFSAVQRDLYNIVLRAHDHIGRIAAPAMPYAHLQRECYRVLGEGLREFGLLRGSMDEILESGALALFMPHGVSHGIGLDVHDCEAMGERSFDLARFEKQAAGSTSCILRSRWILNEGTVLSNEPGLYFIPELIARRRSEGFCRDVVNYAMAERHLDFGGIRVEDMLLITHDGCREIGANSPHRIPITVEQLEGYIMQHRR